MGFKDQGSGDERNERNAQKPGSDISIQDAFEVTTVKKNSKQQRCGHEKIKETSKLLAQRNLSAQPYIKSLLVFAGVGGHSVKARSSTQPWLSAGTQCVGQVDLYRYLPASLPCLQSARIKGMHCLKTSTWALRIDEILVFVKYPPMPIYNLFLLIQIAFQKYYF